MHKPIQLNDVSLSFPHKICFEAFNAQIHYGDRIAIIGRNGSGKSTLLKMLQGIAEPSDGQILMPEDAVISYVPQSIEASNPASGGERFNQALTKALSRDPNILLLDEPTNHLDRRNRKSLLRLLEFFPGTLIIVSHDVELLRHTIDRFWYIDRSEIHVFSGRYEDYQEAIRHQRSAIEQELAQLNRQKKDTHQSLMKEQHRASSSRSKGEKSISQRKWPTVVSNAKAMNASETTGRKKSQIHQKKTMLSEQLSALRLPEIIQPKFSLTAEEVGHRTIVSITDGSVGYQNNILLKAIRFDLQSHDRVAIAGANASGKSTFIKAILSDISVDKAGEWLLPKREDVGYLDQHYRTLDAHDSVFETIEKYWPNKTHAEIRQHLNDFLFRKNEEVNALVSSLSGGEKARLCLAQIAAKTPRLLILDEMTNNLDLETREHVIQVLKNYPGAMILISHDEDFLAQVGVGEKYEIQDRWLILKTNDEKINGSNDKLSLVVDVGDFFT